MKKTYVLDTNVLLTNANCLSDFEDNDIVIPLKVLEEVDGKKKRNDAVGVQARMVNRKLDKLREIGNLKNGVIRGEGLGKLYIAHFDKSWLPEELDDKDPDNQILATAITFE